MHLIDAQEYDCEPYYLCKGEVMVPVHYPQRVILKPRVFGTEVDPFGEWENIHHNTKDASEVYLNNGLPLVLRSGSYVPHWALILLKQFPKSTMLQKVLMEDRLNDQLNELQMLTRYGITTAAWLPGSAGGKYLLKRLAEDIKPSYVIGAANKRHAAESFGLRYLVRKPLNVLP